MFCKFCEKGTPNYEIKRTPEVTLRSNHHLQPAPLISALGPVRNSSRIIERTLSSKDKFVRYDFELVKVVCAEQGFAFAEAGEVIEVLLEKDCVLYMENDENQDDSRLGFKGTSWHSHGNLIFTDSKQFVEMSYLESLVSLGEGSVLICTMMYQDRVRDRWLVHCEYNNEFKHMQPEERLVVFRAQKGVA